MIRGLILSIPSMCQAVWGPAPALLRPLGRDEAEVPEEVTEVVTTIRTVEAMKEVGNAGAGEGTRGVRR